MSQQRVEKCERCVKKMPFYDRLAFSSYACLELMVCKKTKSFPRKVCTKSCPITFPEKKKGLVSERMRLQRNYVSTNLIYIFYVS